MPDELPPLIAADDWVKTPPAVQSLVLELLDMVRQLSSEVQELRVRVNQTSRNSSKPPSTDPPHAPPAPARRSAGRKRGAQPGHADQQRPLLPSEQVDELVLLQPTDCLACHTALPPDLPDAAQWLKRSQCMSLAETHRHPEVNPLVPLCISYPWYASVSEPMSCSVEGPRHTHRTSQDASQG